MLDDLCREHGANLVKSYQSERENWILTMVAAGMGVCFLPEYTATFPGRWVPGRIACGRAQRLPGQRRRPSLVTAGRGFRKSGGVIPGRRRQSLPIGEKPGEDRLPPLNALYGRGHVGRLSTLYPGDI